MKSWINWELSRCGLNVLLELRLEIKPGDEDLKTKKGSCG